MKLVKMTEPKKGVQAFSKNEYLRRLNCVKEEMKKRDIETFFVSNPANLTYLTGYTAKSEYAPQGIVISLHEELPMMIMRVLDVAAGMYQTWLDQEHVAGYTDDFFGIAEMDGYDAVIDYILENGLEKHGVGIESASFVDGIATELKFRRRMPDVKLVACDGLVEWIRAIKSEDEIQVIRDTATITDAAIMRAAEVIRPGVSEAEASAEIMATLIRGVNGISSTDFTWYAMCSTPVTGTCHITWNEGVFSKGSQVNLEVSGVRYGYTAPLMRTYVIGKASQQLKRVHEAELIGMEAALNAVKPGATCNDVAMAFNKALQKEGFDKNTRCGYSVGINWIESISLQVGDMTVLQPNMTFHLMLGNWMESDFGYVLSETFRVTETGAEILTKAPRKIFEIE